MTRPAAQEEIVEEIVSITGAGRGIVEDRVQREMRHLGTNVLADVRRFGVRPHRFDSRMERLYREGDGFIFETLVFWARPERQLWSQHALDRIRLLARRLGRPVETLRILMHGDGAGSDSVFLAENGCTVDYCDVPGSRTFEFAVKRFERRRLLGRGVNITTDPIQRKNDVYDALISFEVLEHIPNPAATIGQFARALRPGGVALVTEAFTYVEPTLPTHLACAIRYEGLAPWLFLSQGMRLTWYSLAPLFKPMEFTKGSHPGLVDWLAMLADRHVVRHLFGTKLKRTLGLVRGNARIPLAV